MSDAGTVEQLKCREYLGDGRWHYWGWIDGAFVSPMQFYNGHKLEQQLFIGHKDKNGTDIYWGDILSGKIQYSKLEGPYPYKVKTKTMSGVTVVRPSKSYLSWHATIRNEDGRECFISLNEEVEIIGNISESPELIPSAGSGVE